MALERLTQITEVGIQSGITLRNVNVEGAYVSGVVTATTLNVTGGGANFAGVVTATSFSGNVTGNITPTGLVVSGVSTFQSSSFWGDGDIAYFGDGQDLLIWHNSTDSIIRDNGTGDLNIEGGNRIKLMNPTGIETYAVFNQDGASELWYDNAKKFETTGAGVTAYGSISVGSNFIGNNAVGLGATTTVGLNAGIGTVAGTIVFNSDSKAVELWNGTKWVTVGGGGFIEATGGDIVDYSEGGIFYRSHIFRSSGTFSVSATPSTSNTVDILMVGGGGSGGTAGGGGAGGLSFIKGQQISASPGSYPIVLGSGGASLGPYPSGVSGTQGNDGSPTTSFGMTVYGGGGGGAYFSTPGYTPTSQGRNAGGSGGGGGWHPVNYANSVFGGISTAPGQGYPGGKGGYPTFYAAYVTGGGGGAGQAGQSAQIYKSGDGGNGLQFTITGQALFYAGGGGGGSQNNNTTSGNGGLGGGGGGGAWNTSVYGEGGPIGYGISFSGQPGAPFGTGLPAGLSASLSTAGDGWGGNGAVSTGAGGGGMGISVTRSGSGGSGIVVVRYPIGGIRTVPKATGGTITYANNKTIHTFLTSGTFTVTSPSLTSVDYLIAAGGGGGGGGFDTNASGGGGGAGGLRTGTGQPVTTTSYPVIVGSGGAGGAGQPLNGSNGGDSSIFSIPVTGGGRGGNWAGAPIPSIANPGGSGGGGANASGPRTGGTGTPGQGNNGGTGAPYNSAANNAGGGGGGAGGAGSPAPSTGYDTVGGPGGVGQVSSISGQSLMYCAGGGGGGGGGGAGYLGVSGSGGNLNINGTSGTVNTGGGGGGGGTGLNSPTTNPLANTIGGQGGSGIVIIAYPS